MFMKHLKKNYAHKSPSVHFEIKAGSEGAPVSIVTGASKVLGAFDIRIAKFDNDQGVEALRAACSVNKDIRITYCTPAVEATMLEVLEPGKSYLTQSTKNCKRALHQTYISESNRMDPSKYDDIFPFEVLEGARRQHIRLNSLISIFEQGVRWEGFMQDGIIEK